jgi:hypothetical protein
LISPLSLIPSDVQRDEHQVGPVGLLTRALRVLSVLEGIVHHYLAGQHKALTEVCAGNQKRSTTRPMAELMLETFREMMLMVVSASGFVHMLTGKHFRPVWLFLCCVSAHGRRFAMSVCHRSELRVYRDAFGGQLLACAMCSPARGVGHLSIRFDDICGQEQSDILMRKNHIEESSREDLPDG